MINADTLQISVLGGLQMYVGEKPVRFAARRAAVFVTYLALTQTTHSREGLATMLWDDRTQKQSMANMRSLLAQMPKEVKPFVAKSRDSLAINADLPVEVDALVFGEAIGREAFDEAVEWYKGEFLAGVTIRDSEGLETWLIMTREQLRQQAMTARQALAEASLRERRFAQGVSHADALVALDPLREGSYQTLMTLLARDGQRGRALQVYGQCRAMLADEFGLEPMAQTTALAQRIRQMQDEPPFVAPNPAGSFIGRTTEQKQVIHTIAQQNLITLVGPGGIGKTRLAIAIAQQLQGHFWDGIYFVELAGLAGETASEETIASFIAAKIGVSLQRTSSAKKQLIKYLAERELFLILDNMEQLLPAGASLIHTLQQNAPQLNLLITSRERLNLQAEHTITLDGLPVQDDTAAVLQLFEQAAQRTKPAFTLSNEQERATALAICDLVEGSPLGVELATAWLNYYSLDYVHQAIIDNLDFIATRHHDIPSRHRSLRAVFQHSWQLLTPAEQQALAQLAIFRGGFTLEAVQAVANVPPPIIFDLVDKSLIRAETQAEPRFVLHDLVRQYAEERQNPAGAITLQQKHATYYLDLLAEPEPTRPIELGNIQRAWKWTIDVRPRTLLTHLKSLTRFYEIAGFFQEAQNNLAHAVDYVTERSMSPDMFELLVQLCLYQASFLTKQGNYPAGISSAETAYQLATNPDDKMSARLHLSRIAGLQGQHDRALEYAQEHIDYYEKVDNPQAVAQALDIIGSVYTRQGQYEKAQAVLQRAVNLARQLDDTILIGYLVHLGTAHLELADYDNALRYHQEARDIAKRHNYQERIAQTTNNIGLAHWRIGDRQTAINNFLEAEQMAINLGHMRGQVVTRGNIGIIYKELKEFDKALMAYEEALAIAEQAGLRWEMARNLGNIGNVRKEQGKFDEALPYLRQALAIDKALANKDGVARHLNNIGNIHRIRGDYQEALTYLNESIALAREGGARFYLCSYLIYKAMTLYELGHTAEAKALNEEGLALAKQAKRIEAIEEGEAFAQKLAASPTSSTVTQKV